MRKQRGREEIRGPSAGPQAAGARAQIQELGSSVRAQSVQHASSLSEHTHPWLAAHGDSILTCLLSHPARMKGSPSHGAYPRAPRPPPCSVGARTHSSQVGADQKSPGNAGTCLQALSVCSSHRFLGFQGLFLFCPWATLLNISRDEPIYQG